jgi:hypothetical protein
MPPVCDDVLRLDFEERERRHCLVDGAVLRAKRTAAVDVGVSRVVRLSDDVVELEGAYDKSDPPRLAGARPLFTLRKTPLGPEGYAIGYQQQVLTITLKRQP